MTRFWDKVDISAPDSCWNWKACKDQFGYGQFAFKGRSHKAHRMAFVFTDGELPEGLCVLHKCDNPACVNPAHLFLGTKGDNNRDCVSKGRNKQPRWDCQPKAKITLGQAREIKRRGTSGEKRCDLAKEFGLSAVAVSYLCNGRNWKGLEV